MTSTQSITTNDENVIPTIDQPNQIITEKINQSFVITKTWTERIKTYFITNDGRIALADLFFTLICVILQHVMGTCQHYVSDGIQVIKWYVFTPPCM
jgi:hypothetical protein